VHADFTRSNGKGDRIIGGGGSVVAIGPPCRAGRFDCIGAGGVQRYVMSCPRCSARAVPALRRVGVIGKECPEFRIGARAGCRGPDRGLQRAIPGEEDVIRSAGRCAGRIKDRDIVVRAEDRHIRRAGKGLRGNA